MWPGRSSVAGSAPVDSKVTIVDPPAARLEAESRGMCRDLSVKWTTRAVGWWSAMDMPWRRRFPSTRQPRSFKRVEARRPTPMSCGYDRARTAGGDCRRPHVRNETTSCGTDRFLQVDGLAEGSHRTFRAAVSPITPPWAQKFIWRREGERQPDGGEPTRGRPPEKPGEEVTGRFERPSGARVGPRGRGPAGPQFRRFTAGPRPGVNEPP